MTTLASHNRKKWATIFHSSLITWISFRVFSSLSLLTKVSKTDCFKIKLSTSQTVSFSKYLIVMIQIDIMVEKSTRFSTIWFLFLLFFSALLILTIPFFSHPERTDGFVLCHATPRLIGLSPQFVTLLYFRGWQHQSDSFKKPTKLCSI